MDATDFPAHSDDRSSTPLERPELLCIFLFLAIAAVSWVGIALAELGWFAGSAVLGAGAMLTAASWWLAIRGIRIDHPAPFGRMSRPKLASLAMIFVLSAWLFARPGQYIFEGFDASVYLAVSRTILQTGRIVAPDPLLDGLPEEAREDLFIRDPNWPHLLNRFPGGLQIAEGRDDIVPSFFHLLPVWIAVLGSIAGVQAGFFVNVIFGVLAIVQMWLLGCRLRSAGAGAVAAMLVALNFGEIWLARIQLSEMLAQWALLSGLYLAVVAWDRRLRVAACSSGIAFGLSALVRIDGLLMLPLIVAIVMFTWRGRDRRGLRGWFLAGAIALGSHALAHALLVSRPYTLRLLTSAAQGIMGLAIANGRVMAAALVIATLVPGMVLLAVRRLKTPSIRRRVVTTGVLASALVLGLFTPGVAGPFAQLLSPLGLAMAAAGLVVVIWREPEVRTRMTTTMFAAQWVLFFMWHEPTTLPLEYRRYMPVVLPLAALFIGYFVSFAFAWRSRLKYLATLLPVALGALFIMKSAPLLASPPMRDAYAAIAAVADRIPPGSIVVADRSVPSHVSVALQYHFERSGVRVAEREGLKPGLQALFAHAQAARRPLFTLIGRYEGDVRRRLARADLAGFDVGPVDTLPFQYTFLETSRTAFPNRIQLQSDRLELCRVAPPNSTAPIPLPAVVDIGDRDFPYLLDGFHGSESILGSVARWTAGTAAVWLPPIAIPSGASARLTLRAFAYRPPHVPPPVIELLVDDIPIGRITNPSADFGAYPLALNSAASDKLRSRSTVLTIRCTPFSPRQMGLSADGRVLGIAVDFVRID